MNKLKQNASGFGAIEAILIIVVIALVGFVGWTVYKNRPKATPASDTSANTTTSKPTPDPYAGWNTSTLKNEKVTFKYPSDWQLVDNSDTQLKADHIELKGTNGFDMSIEAMPQFGALASDSPTNIVYTQPVTMLGRTVYLDFIESLLESTKVGHVDISTSATDAYKALPAKNVAPQDGIFNIGVSYGDASGNVPKSLDEIKNDKNYKDAVLVLQSMHY